jgi:hypothetical protein
MRTAELAASLGAPRMANCTAGPSPCCARDASGHAAAAPPSSVMNSRRFIVAIIQSSRRFGSTRDFAERASRNIQPGCRLVRLDAHELDHLGPLLGFVGYELSELDRCHRQRHTADFGQALYNFGITQQGIHFAIELPDDVSGRILGHPYTVP